MSRAADLQALQAEADGIMGFHVLQPRDVPELLGCAARGELDALQLVNVLCDLLERIAHAPRDKPMLCSCCSHRLRRSGFTGFSVIIASPERPDASRCLALAICDQCERTPEAIQVKAMQAFRRIWPDARPITIDRRGAGQA